MQEDGDTRSKHLELLFHRLHPAAACTRLLISPLRLIVVWQDEPVRRDQSKTSHRHASQAR